MAKAIIRLPDEMHRALKIEAVNRGLTMQALVQAAIRRELGAPARTRPDASSGPASAGGLGSVSSEESELLTLLLEFLRREPGRVRAAGVRVVQALTQREGPSGEPVRAKARRSAK